MAHISVEIISPPLAFTGNDVQDIITFIQEKNLVILHTTSAFRVFHTISFYETDGQESLARVRAVYIDCSYNPGLLNEGEWDLLIRNAITNVTELGSESLLRARLIDRIAVPNIEEFTI